MGIELTEQLMIFLKACIIGACFGVFYDIFRILRLATFASRVVVFIEDIIFFIICTLITYVYILQATEGQIRFFVILGELLGFILYYFTIGALVYKLSQIIISWIKKLLKLLYKIFIHPIIKLFSWISGKIIKICKNNNIKIKKFIKNRKIHLKNQRALRYNKRRINKLEKERKFKGKRRTVSRAEETKNKREFYG